MLGIQLGGKIINQIKTGSSGYLLKQLPLGQLKCTHNQLLLAARQHLNRRPPIEANTQISALRASLCESHLKVARPTLLQHFLQAALPTPASQVMISEE